VNHSAKGLDCFPITDRDEGRVLTQSDVSPVAQPSRCRDYVDPSSQSLRDCEVPELLDRDAEKLDQALARAISTGRSPPLITAAGHVRQQMRLKACVYESGLHGRCQWGRE
jgi:hypothetical protein